MRLSKSLSLVIRQKSHSTKRSATVLRSGQPMTGGWTSLSLRKRRQNQTLLGNLANAPCRSPTFTQNMKIVLAIILLLGLGTAIIVPVAEKARATAIWSEFMAFQSRVQADPAS